MPNIKTLPIVPLRGITVFPNMVLHFDAGRDQTVTALEEAMLNNQECMLVSQKDARQSDLEVDNIYSYGTIANIKQILKLPGDSIRVLVEGVERAKIIEFTKTEPYFEAQVEIAKPQYILDEALSSALSREIQAAFEKYNSKDPKLSDILLNLIEKNDVGKITDMIASNIIVQIPEKQRILELYDVVERAQVLIRVIKKETEIKKLSAKIQAQVKRSLDKSQREYYLNEQMRVIRKELGQEESQEAFGEEMLVKLSQINLSEEVFEKSQKEIKKLISLPSNAHEAPLIRTWIETFFSLPWNKYSQDDFDLKKAQLILDKDHYALEKVKERIIQHLAVCKLRNDTQGTIICLVGPPGVGKTSIASSIAKAVGRSFVRMSLGGVRDEAEIRGHRRTYIGAIPGRIIDAFKKAKTMNPIILLDEIDKMGNDYRGDPAAAMLEVLDSAQNTTFRDHYMEIPFDISKAMFIMTANTTSTIPRPLLDRMEIVELSSYTVNEKVQIAKKHLFAKQAKEHGLQKSSIKVSSGVWNEIVESYTREAGVRSLERKIAQICRVVATTVVEQETQKVSITSKNLEKFLGVAKFSREKLSKDDQIGTVNGLAWTSVGGETLTIEVISFQGRGKMEITGQIGSVMRESASAAYTYVKANAVKYGINPEDFNNIDIHIHIPEGAIPKDGPSAGISLATAIVSSFNGYKVKSNVAMTGEITLHGKVLPIGGLKEKLIAAHREGIKTIILPFENKKDVEQVPLQILEEINIVFAKDVQTVFETALCSIPEPFVCVQNKH